MIDDFYHSDEFAPRRTQRSAKATNRANATSAV
jgi:hypothetical protein